MTRLIVGVVCLGTLALWACPAVPQTGGARIEPANVAVVLSPSDHKLAPDRVMLPVLVPVVHPAPALEVLSLQSVDALRSKVKLRCRQQTECLPFYAIVDWANHENQERASQFWTKALQATSQSAAPVSAPWLVRAGEPATLILERASVRIQLPVICLGNGNAGNYVRVMTSDHHHTYRAQVLAVGTLKGEW